MDAMPPADEEGRRALPLAGAAVVQCCIDFAVTVRCDREGAAFEVRLEQEFVFSAADGTAVLLDPESDPVGLGPVLACTRTTVLQATAFEDGRLEMLFADGSSVRVPTSIDYEGWSLDGPAGLQVVSGPGPTLTIWRPDDDGQEMR
jgi:hypothetical protein